ncbi:MAG: hypothetical protein RR921_06885 [Mucinivorans sp.]
MSAQNSIKVTVDDAQYPIFTIGEQEYHITLKGDTKHVTTTNRDAHYGYETTLELINGKWTTVISDKKLKKGHVFSELPENVQKFIRKNYDEIMKIKQDESKYLSL